MVWYLEERRVGGEVVWYGMVPGGEREVGWGREQGGEKWGG